MSTVQNQQMGGQSQDRPVGVMLISMLYAFGGIALGLLGIAFVGFADAISDVPLAEEATGFVLAFALIVFVLAAIHLALMWGIWNMTEWGWIGGLITSVLYGLIHLLGTIDGELVSVVFLAVTVGVIYFLYDKQTLFRG